MYVMMSVKMIDKQCLTCPGFRIAQEDRTFHSDTDGDVIDHDLYCKNVKQCEQLVKIIESKKEETK